MRHFIALSLLVLLVMIGAFPVYSQQTIDVRIETVSAQPNATDINVRVWAESLDGLGVTSVALALAFDKSVILAKSVNVSGTLLDGLAPTTNPDNDAGFLRFNANAVAALSGGGLNPSDTPLAILVFDAVPGSMATTTLSKDSTAPAIANLFGGELAGQEVEYEPNFINGEVSLPVELSVLTATRTPEGVLIRWRTESETNNLGFDVYRIVNGKTIKVNAQIIHGQGTTGNPRDYQFLDPDALDGADLRYFIEDIDLTGNREQSHIIAVGGLQGRRLTTWGRIKARQ